MKSIRALLGVSTLCLSSLVSGADLDQLKVLFVGDLDSPRTGEFKEFLELNVGKVGLASRQGFDPASANSFDVVLLDWPQSGTAQGAWERPCPLGERDEWSKPTVLLGSAGLNLAVSWKGRGGSG